MNEQEITEIFEKYTPERGQWTCSQGKLVKFHYIRNTHE